MEFKNEDLALITLSQEGLASARALQKHLPGASLHLHQAVPAESCEPFEKVAELSRQLWHQKRGLVYFAPSGAILRAIAPLIESKYKDPAVVLCDVHARWAVSFLSGHEGGANDLTLLVANHLGAEPVITTTSEAVKDVILGVGCTRGCPAETLKAAILEALDRVQMPLERVRYLASADLKSDEPGLQEVAKTLELPLRFLPSLQIQDCQRPLSPSPVAERNVGLPGVAEPCALLAGQRTRLVLPRTVLHGCTVAVALEDNAYARLLDTGHSNT